MLALPFIVMALIYVLWEGAERSVWFTLLYYLATIGLGYGLQLEGRL